VADEVLEESYLEDRLASVRSPHRFRLDLTLQDRVLYAWHMQPTSRSILDLLDRPEELEALYRRNPGAFRESLAEASRGAPDSTTLRVWRARLDFEEAAIPFSKRRLWHAVGVGLGLGATVRIPALWSGEEWHYPRFGPSLVLLAVAAYFWLENRDRRGLVAGGLLAAVAVAFASSLPGDAESFTDSVIMALIHLPILFWALLGFVFTGAAWRDAGQRIRFVRYNGELLILASLVALGGIVFSGLTVALFQLLSEDSEATAEWYVQNVGVIGAAAVPLAGTYLYDVVFNERTRIASVLARVFAPLFLLMTGIYLVAALLGGENPFVDRDFLITVNGLLLVVLGMTVFSIAERGGEAELQWIDYINVALLLVTLIIDLIALSAIVFRLTSYGLTPNRVVVLGANLVVMTHLTWTCRAYLGLIGQRGGVAEIRRAVTDYLPVYVGWAVLVTFVMPFLFRFS
jgi:hypothetical protein